ncbi:Na+/H+ antiporter NhaA [Acidipropionibacterium acidipropionici]|uniref:Na+/H+ antiporter NhaA n=1 Tax=Acidipropionibacterium acidipropionici TaxID=1748 RepID=UPI00110AA512|nr:Na+/H+ antiporter NhaA [Acidipropionibacterium acidipropionici]QCV94084.1 Na+/H+ antiporter NhaA [Acidipropionibacterium acidipropionici]
MPEGRPVAEETVSSEFRGFRRGVRAQRLLSSETPAALALGLATLLAVVWANIGSSYESVWTSEFGLKLGTIEFQRTLREWTDEGIMSVFFFMVGLDVRRELTLGELRSGRRAVLPLAAALGGLVVPALIFLAIAGGGEYGNAWGTVISTDTAFALGLLAVVAPRNAPRLRVFLLALAVVDDIAALAVIAFVYTDEVTFPALGLAALGLLAVWGLERLNVWRPLPYALIGVYTWFCFQASGVHATLAGVLIALLMPVYPLRGRDLRLASRVFNLFHQAPRPDMARRVHDAVSYSVPLNQRLSSLLTPYVNYLVVPLFAIANAGVLLNGETISGAATSSLTWGIVAGLVVGKAVGITLAATLVIRLLPSSRLPGLDVPRIAGAGALSGMGFTISLLVIGMAVDDSEAADEARVGVLVASLLALVLAWAVFSIGERLRPLDPPAGQLLDREVDTESDHIWGDQDAPATLVVYAGMNPAYRQHTARALREAAEGLGPDRVRIVWRHHAITEETRTAAFALEAASAQGQFWRMHDELVGTDKAVDNDTMREAAERIGLDLDAFERRRSRQSDRERIENDNLDLEGSEATEKPLLYLNGEHFTDPVNSFNLQSALE